METIIPGLIALRNQNHPLKGKIVEIQQTSFNNTTVLEDWKILDVIGMEAILHRDGCDIIAVPVRFLEVSKFKI